MTSPLPVKNEDRVERPCESDARTAQAHLCSTLLGSKSAAEECSGALALDLLDLGLSWFNHAFRQGDEECSCCRIAVDGKCAARCVAAALSAVSPLHSCLRIDYTASVQPAASLVHSPLHGRGAPAAQLVRHGSVSV